MGWLTAKGKSGEVHYSDATADLAAEFLLRLGEIYSRSELARLPTLEEVAFNLESVLAADPALYCEDGDGLELTGVVLKTKRQPAQRKPAVGDVVAIPVTRSRNIFAQIRVVWPGTNGVIGLYPIVAEGMVTLASLADREFVAHIKGELTGVPWRHWRVMGQMRASGELTLPDKMSPVYPCFLVAIEAIKALQEAGVMDREFRLYGQVSAYHPKFWVDNAAAFAKCMEFFRAKRLLTDLGEEELSEDRIDEDFALHSELLTKDGNRFVDGIVQTNGYEALKYDVMEVLEREFEEFT